MMKIRIIYRFNDDQKALVKCCDISNGTKFEKFLQESSCCDEV